MHLKLSSLVRKVSSRNRSVGYEKMDAAVVKKKSFPRGIVPVCVGEDHIRYEIPVECLNSLKFMHFLKQHEDLDTRDEPIRLLCSTLVFESVLNLAKAEAKRQYFGC